MPTRRRVLDRIAGLSGVLGAAAVTGCLDESGSGSEAAGYTDWLATPELFGGRRYFFDYYDVRSIREQRASFEPSVYDAYRAWAVDGYDHFGLSFDAVDEELLSVNRRVTNIRGEWDVGTLVDSLESSGYIEMEPHAGFKMFRHRFAELSVAVSDDRLLRARRTARSPAGTAELFVDTGAGTERRYVETDITVAELTDLLGQGTVVYGFPHRQTETTRVEDGQFRGARARGVARTVDGEETTDGVVVTFDTTDDVIVEDVRAWVDAEPRCDGVRSVDVRTEARSAVVTVRRRTADLDAVAPRYLVDFFRTGD